MKRKKVPRQEMVTLQTMASRKASLRSQKPTGSEASPCKVSPGSACRGREQLLL